jgi:uncharacterized membrane protein SirB2
MSHKRMIAVYIDLSTGIVYSDLIIGGFVSYNFYSFLHIVSVVVIAMSLAIVSFQIYGGAQKATIKNRKGLSITHGVALLVAFVAGFGLITKGGFSFSTSSWIYIKMVCWLLLGVYPVLLYKELVPRKMALLGLALILTVAVFTVVFKPI